MYTKHYSRLKTPQRESAPGKAQVKNSAGGYVFSTGDWLRAQRFLILGNEGGSYYANERTLTVENAGAVERCLNEDGPRMVEMIGSVMDTYRAAKPDAPLFAFSLALSSPNDAARSAAFANFNRIVKTGRQLALLLEMLKSMRGWGRGLRNAVSGWYTDKPLDSVAYQTIKYRQREGWGHLDIMRMAHPKPLNAEQDRLFRYLVKGEMSDGLPRIVQGYERAKAATSAAQIVELIHEYRLTWEMVPSEYANNVEVMAALAHYMPAVALLRQLGRYTAAGLIAPLSDNNKLIVDKLGAIASRVHPVNILHTINNYRSGSGKRLSWHPVPDVLDALEDAFYKSFDFTEPTNARIYQAIDVSGSMSSHRIFNTDLSTREAAAAMALTFVKAENNVYTAGFSDSAHTGRSPDFYNPRSRDTWFMREMNIGKRTSLSEAINICAYTPAGGTDCALPIIDATNRNIPVDAFIIYTDNETWHGNIHPFQALQKYRKQSGINAKMVVVGMVSNGFTIADPDDDGSLDVVGFDTAAPKVIQEFIAGGWDLS